MKAKEGFFNRINFGIKIIVFILIGFILTYIINYLIVAKEIEKNSLEALKSKAKAITMEAENARQYVSRLRADGSFAEEAMIDELKATLKGAEGKDNILKLVRETKYYWTIPVVAGWTVGMTNASEAGHDFKVVRRGARNSINEATPVEVKMLEEMDRHNLDDYFVIDEKINALRYMRAIYLQPECMVCHGTVNDYPEGEGLDPVGIEMEGWEAGQRKGAFEIIADLGPMQKSISDTLSKMLLVGSIVIALIVFKVYLIIKKFAVNPIRDLRKIIGRVSKGDLTVKAQVKTGDDIGQLAISMNQMVSSFSTMIMHILRSSEAVFSSVKILSKSSSDTVEGVQHQTEQAAQIATAAEEMTQTVTNIAHNASSVSETSNEAMVMAEKGKEISDGAVNTINTVFTSTKELATMVDTLNNRVVEIGDILTVINDIADQTNLLALNAAIEAARAGEQGRGFAVVADEVRQLAERTIKATAEISNKIKAVQVESKKTNDSMEQSSNEVTKATEYISNVGQSLSSIVNAVSQVRNEISQIASAVEQQSAVSEEVAQNIEKTLGIANDIEKMSSEVMNEVEGLINTADELRKSTAGFSIDKNNK